MLKKIAVLVLSTSLALPALAAPDNWLAKAQEINRVEIGKRDPQAKQTFYREGSVAENREVSFQVKLQAGKYYGFMGDCDYECNEASLFLSQNGNQLNGMHEEDNSSPMFGYRANKTGTYNLTYKIQDCEKNRCAYSIQVFEGNKTYQLDF